jgi:hypothetical protein
MPLTGLYFLRRGRDSNPRYGFKPVQRFSKPALSATQAPLRCKAAKIHVKKKIKKPLTGFESLPLQIRLTPLASLGMNYFLRRSLAMLRMTLLSPQIPRYARG